MEQTSEARLSNLPQSLTLIPSLCSVMPVLVVNCVPSNMNRDAI